jgi:hypothetical protein
MSINAVANGVMLQLYLQHGCYNINFKPNINYVYPQGHPPFSSNKFGCTPVLYKHCFYDCLVNLIEYGCCVFTSQLFFSSNLASVNESSHNHLHAHVLSHSCYVC